MNDPLSDSLQEFDAAVHALEAAVAVQPALAQVLFGDTREWRKLLTFKLLEMHARRDLFVVIFLCFFLLLTNFFYSQSIATANLARSRW